MAPAERRPAAPLVDRAAAPGHRRAGEDGRTAHRGARPLRRRGEDRRHRRRTTHHPLRAAPRARDQDEQGRSAQGRPRLRARRDRHQDPRPDPRQDRGRRRGSQPAPPHRAARRRLPGRPGGLVAADRVARQGRRRQGDRRRPGEDAPPARRGHDGRGQVRRDQRDALQPAAARHAARAAPRADRSQAGRAQPLRVDPASAHARHHEPADGRQRAAEPRPRDGAALLGHVAGQDALAHRAQPLQGQARRAAAALHPLRHRRAGGPHDGRPGRRRGLDHPPCPEGTRGRHPPRARDAVAARRRHHRHDQGQRPVADRVQRVLADRLAGHPRRQRRGVAARPGRHALLARRIVAPAAHPGRLHRRAADRGADDVLAQAGRARAARGPARRGPQRGGHVGGRTGRRLQPRRGPAAGGRDPALRGDGNGLDLDAPAPLAPRLHARRAAHRHARAARRHLRLRGIQAAPGARRRRRRRARDREPARARRHRGRLARRRARAGPRSSPRPLRSTSSLWPVGGH